MPENEYQKEEETRNRLAASSAQTQDVNQVLSTLNEVFIVFEKQLQSRLDTQAPKPFSEAAQKAVDTFRDVVAGLSLRVFPAQPELKAKVYANEILLTWTTSDGPNNIDSFRLRRAQGSGSQNFTDLVSPLSGSAREYRDQGLTNGAIYRYELIAVNSRGEAASKQVELRTDRK